eukprot:Amastigsp_a177846_15.p5 type:complete len:117 gc:universal Amastigsp_a177846_15:397-47(-)
MACAGTSPEPESEFSISIATSSSSSSTYTSSSDPEPSSPPPDGPAFVALSSKPKAEPTPAPDESGLNAPDGETRNVEVIGLFDVLDCHDTVSTRIFGRRNPPRTPAASSEALFAIE